MQFGQGLNISGGLFIHNVLPVPTDYIVVAGGGGSGGGGYWVGGNGGSGVVIIRYADTYAAASTTGSPTYTVTGGYRTYTFTGSGSITF